jgi:hypothetical protein
MTQLDKLYLMLLNGEIDQRTYNLTVAAYNAIPQVERSRYDN